MTVLIIILSVALIIVAYKYIKLSKSTKPIDKSMLPNGVDIDEKTLLPYKTNRVYGYGKEFNAFVTPNGKYFHRSRCNYVKSHKKILMHRYEALKKNYLPCPYCKPVSKVNAWYDDFIKKNNILD